MSHLIEEYAKSCGVKIGKPFLKSHFFPIKFNKYITIHSDSNIQSKKYSYWDEVISLVKPFLEKENIKIIQIGTNNEQLINGIDLHSPTNTLKQCAYIIQNSLAHVGIDSVPVHIASSFDIPIVSIYAHTYAMTCNPYWNEKSNVIIIESDRDGRKPSFSYQENPQMIDKIFPEKIAQSILDILKINNKINRKTINIGENYNRNFCEVIPREFSNIQNENLNIRMDLFHNEEILLKILQNNKSCHVTLNQPISIEALKSNRIAHINYKSDSFDKEFVKQIRNLGIKETLLCSSKENLANERFELFDFTINYYNEKEIIEENKKKFLEIDFKNIKIKSSKKIALGDNLYECLFDLNQRQDLDEFFLDIDWLMIYDEIHE